MKVAFVCLLPLLLAACTAVRAEPETGANSLRCWGSMREALRDGRTEARIDAGTLAQPGVFAIGAAAGLDGEITIADGQVFVSRVRNGELETANAGAAAVLIAAEVPEWTELAVTAEVDPSQFDEYLAARAAEVGLDAARPFPFVIDGGLRDLQVHVIAGECPIRARMLGVTMTCPPYERRFATTRGRLVGIHARDAAGRLTHHDTATHTHVILDHGAPFTGHVETVGLAAGSVLRLPAHRVWQ